MYVESTGVLGRLNQTKHRGVTTVSDSISSPSSPVLEKETTLRISYRIRLRDNAIYFGLIIYERITSNNNLRRNLCLDFNGIAEQERRETILKARSLETPKKRKTPLKRLMFIWSGRKEDLATQINQWRRWFIFYFLTLFCNCVSKKCMFVFRENFWKK